jgi:RHS repeat-associated protein
VTDATGALRSIEATLAGRRLDLQVVAQDAGGRVTDVSSSALPGDRRVVFDEAGRQVRAWLPSGSGSVDSSVGAVYVYATEDGKRSRETLAFKLKGTEDSTYAYSVGGKLVSATTNGVSTRFAYAPITGALSQFRRGLESSVTITTDYLGRPTRAGSSVYAWDSLGRRSYSTTAIDSWSSYGWDGQRLTSIWNPTRYSATYLYDAHGQRLRSTVTSAGVTATTNWAYDGRRLQGYSTSASNGATWSVDYLYDPAGAPFAGVYRASDAAATPFSVRTNARGDVRELLDAEGRAFGFYSYDAYGAPREVVSASTGLVSSVLAARIVGRQPLRYAGYVWDSESRLYYVAERYYDPATASFLSRDPLQAPGDESAYLYCGGNPVDRTDPEGTIFLSLQDRVRYNRIRSRLLAAARQLVNWQVKYSSDAAHTQKPELRGQMDCSGAVAWVLRQADPWFAKRIPSPTSSRRWNTDSFVANLDWRTTYRGAARYAPGSPWKVGDVLVKGWVGNKMGHIVIVVREGTRPQVFECAASSGGGYASGARIVPLKDRVASWKPAYAGRLFAQEPNAPYGGIR